VRVTCTDSTIDDVRYATTNRRDIIPPISMTFSAGTRLGLYEITGLLGSGGMGEVYQATDTKLGRFVAIKVLPDLLAQDPERALRFEREARVLAAGP